MHTWGTIGLKIKRFELAVHEVHWLLEAFDQFEFQGGSVAIENINQLRVQLNAVDTQKGWHIIVDPD